MIKLHNTLTRKVEPFKEIHKGEVRMYACGPTIYDFGHLGHGRSAVVFDILRKYFEYKGYEVKFVFNYTDIEDKMINRANEEKITVKQLADRFEKIYDEDYKKLNVKPPTEKPKATEHIPEMIEIIKKLEKNGFVYVIEDDGVYFDVKKFEGYGKLSHQNIEDLESGKRIDVNEKKKSPNDFVLWKFKKENEPFWDSPWGEGRPGWHIECSAMSMKYLGEHFDIHGGGQDLIFPHHEDEIAQSEAATGKKWVNYWVHNGFITVNKEKMSKSLKNFTTLRDAMKDYEPNVLRFFYLTTHYRAPLDLSEENVEQAKNTLKRILEFMRNLKFYHGIVENIKVVEIIKEAKKKFEDAMDDDLNISEALAAIFELMKETNTLMAEKNMSDNDAKKIITFVEKIDSVLGILEENEEEVPEDILWLAMQREDARKKKDFRESDRIRDELKEKGYEVADTKDGPRVIKLKN
jgi:cysteinyl-tRNA synthetase